MNKHPLWFRYYSCCLDTADGKINPISVHFHSLNGVECKRTHHIPQVKVCTKKITLIMSDNAWHQRIENAIKVIHLSINLPKGMQL